VRQGLDNGWFVVRYQPQFDISTGRLQGFEALLRLQHPQLGVVPAADFVPVAEEMGLMVRVGELAIREACRAAVRWPQELRLAINLSAGQFRRGDIVKTLLDALTANHLSPPRIDLDLDERLFAGQATAQVSEQLRRLSDLGFRLILDHLGSGRASPRDLHDHPLHAVKLDGSLVRRLGQERGAERLLTGVIRLAEALDLQVMADGVEAAEQVHFLMLNNCRHIQGRICGGVVSADRLRAIIAKDLKNMSEAGEASGGRAAAAAA
jgi:EAL domain-containing protein (putative c-di-GMP-specific phosphodiesterase class I)